MTSTRTAPAASPNMAREIAMNAKWYHIVTLKILVRNSSSCKSDRVVKKSPAYVNFVGSELEDDTEAHFQQVQRMALALNGSYSCGKNDRNIERGTRNHKTADVRSNSNRAGRKNLYAAPIVHGESSADLTDRRQPGRR